MYGFGIGGGHWGGAFCDQLTIPYADAMLSPLPDVLDPVAAASVADNVCDGYRHVAPYLPDLLQHDPCAPVLIVAGVTRRPVVSPSIPLYAGLAARALGARTIYFADTRSRVRDHAGNPPYPGTSAGRGYVCTQRDPPRRAHACPHPHSASARIDRRRAAAPAGRHDNGSAA